MSEENKIDDYMRLFIEISSKLASIDTKMGTLCATMAQHEQRITSLEQTKKCVDDSFKGRMLDMLGKCLIIALTSIATLVGAGSLVMRIVGS